MHTFELSCYISSSAYQYLHDNLPSLDRVGKYTERTNYYSAKGITQIELKIYEYPFEGVMMSRHYVFLRCNPSIIMGDSEILAIDLHKYSIQEIIDRLMKRIYEINEFRYIRLHQFPISLFLTNRADIALDVCVENPQLIIWLCNMAFPYHYRKMNRKKIDKDIKTLYKESCCFVNGSREVNFYHKWSAIINTDTSVDNSLKEVIFPIVRFEIQIKKQGIYNLKLPSKRQITPFLQEQFCKNYILSEVKSIYGTCKFVSRSIAVGLIQSSSYKKADKQIMVSIIDMIQGLNGLYRLEEMIADDFIATPVQYGNLRKFKEKWLGKFKQLGFSPVVIPDQYGIDEVPSIYELLEKGCDKCDTRN